jgi:type IV pilus biogenesis protein CpaD/CtpE
MKSISRNFILGIFAIAACCDALGADDKWLENEALGKIKLEQKAADVTALIGKPDSRGEDAEWDAIGAWVQEWRFQAHGLVLNMASESKAGAKTVLTITATAPSKLATARGIHIGSTIAEVSKAYGKVQDKEQSDPAKTFVAGSIYGGVIFTFDDGKVEQIFIGAAAE